MIEQFVDSLAKFMDAFLIGNANRIGYAIIFLSASFVVILVIMEIIKKAFIHHPKNWKMRFVVIGLGIVCVYSLRIFFPNLFNIQQTIILGIVTGCANIVAFDGWRMWRRRKEKK